VVVVSEPGSSPARPNARCRDRGCAQLRRAQTVCGDSSTAAPHCRPRPQWFEQRLARVLRPIDAVTLQLSPVRLFREMSYHRVAAGQQPHARPGSPCAAAGRRAARPGPAASVRHHVCRWYGQPLAMCCAHVVAFLSNDSDPSPDPLSAPQPTRTSLRTPSWPPSCCGSCGRPAPRTPWCCSKVHRSPPGLSCWPKGLTRRDILGLLSDWPSDGRGIFAGVQQP